MKIIRDEPQDLLLLESPRANLPRGAVRLVVALVLGVVVLVTFGPPLLMIASGRVNVEGLLSDLPLFLLLTPISLIGPLFLYRGLRGRFNATVKVRIDRRAGELEIENENPIFTTGPTVTPLASVVRLAVGTALVRPHWVLLRAGRNPMVQGVRLFLEWQDGGRKRSRTVTFPVDNLDKREEVADLAYRMGRAAGLLFSRVLRSDERDLEVEVTRDRYEGSESLPRFDGPAEYAKDIVAPQALRAASVEVVPAFVPAEFKSRSRVSVWEPRREVRFQKPAGLMAIGCMPFTLLVLTGPAILLLPASGPGMPAGKYILAGVMGLAGLFVAWMASEVVKSEAGRTVTLDWAHNHLKVRGGLFGQTYALSDIHELDLRSLRRPVRTRSGSYDTYACEIRAHLRPGAVVKEEPVLLVETDSFREDPDTPYRLALPLATELADALNVPRRVTAST